MCVSPVIYNVASAGCFEAQTLATLQICSVASVMSTPVTKDCQEAKSHSTMDVSDDEDVERFPIALVDPSTIFVEAASGKQERQKKSRQRAAYLYVGYDEMSDGTIVYQYAGQSFERLGELRIRRHKKGTSGCPMVKREVERRKQEGLPPLKWKLVPGLEGGVAAHLNNVWETWVMYKFETLYNDKTNRGLNQKGSEDLKQYIELKSRHGGVLPDTVAEFAELLSKDPELGVGLTSTQLAVRESDELTMLYAERAMLEDVQDTVGDVMGEEEQLYTLARIEKLNDMIKRELEDDYGGDVNLNVYVSKAAERLVLKYAALDFCDSVNKDALSAELNEIGELCGAADKNVKKTITCFQSLVHPDKSATFNAATASKLVQALQEMIFHEQELNLDKTNRAVKLFVDYRAVALKKGGRPVENGIARAGWSEEDASKERTAARTIRTWSENGKQNIEAAYIILRNVECAKKSVFNRIHGDDCKQKIEATRARLKHFLKLGLGHKEDPFKTRVLNKETTNSDADVISLFGDLCAGRYEEELVKKIVSACDNKERAAWYLARWAQFRPAYFSQQQENLERLKNARAQSRGFLKEAKRVKTAYENGESASAM